MPISFPPLSFPNWPEGLRRIGSLLGSLLRDEGQPPRWDDLRCPSSSTRTPGVGGVTYDDNEIGWPMAAAGTSIIQGDTQLPHRWLEGSTVVPHIHVWSPSTATATADAVTVWRFEYRWYNPQSGAVPAGYASATVTHTLALAARQSAIIELGRHDGTGKTISSIYKWRLTRIGAATADTYAGAVYVDEFDLHIQSDTSRGSHDEHSKWAG